ncbi:hypothetical protein [Streptomyces atratus]|uniref:hypothetical protein n=1 Tax=Streptomyces atratus TaxID=1893 RepID=UPI0033CECD00
MNPTALRAVPAAALLLAVTACTDHSPQATSPTASSPAAAAGRRERNPPCTSG